MSINNISSGFSSQALAAKFSNWQTKQVSAEAGEPKDQGVQVGQDKFEATLTQFHKSLEHMQALDGTRWDNDQKPGSVSVTDQRMPERGNLIATEDGFILNTKARTTDPNILATSRFPGDILDEEVHYAFNASNGTITIETESFNGHKNYGYALFDKQKKVLDLNQNTLTEWPAEEHKEKNHAIFAY